MTTRPITVQDIAHLPAPGTSAPSTIRFSPDGRLVTYLYSSAGTLTMELWAYDRQTGREWRLLDPAEEPSPETQAATREEALRRERQRQYTGGVTAYAWSHEGETLLARMQGDVLVRHGVDGIWRRLDDSRGWIDPKLSRDGAKLAFVQDAELYTLDLRDPEAQPRRLTFDASPAGPYGDREVTNGLAEFVAQEEMDRSSGFWWSPDGSALAFEQVDHSPVPLYLIPHPGADTADVEAHRYPFAGKENVRVRLGVVPADGGEVRWLPLGDEADLYLARVDWTPDGLLLVQVLSRDQKRLDVRRIDPANGAAVTLWTERCEPWINLTDDLRAVQRRDSSKDDYTFVWSSERGGARELELRDRDGRLVRQLTDGAVFVDGVVSVDAEGGSVYFAGWRTTPLERQLFRVPLAGGPVEQITRASGTHLCAVAPNHSCFADRFDSLRQPPTVTLRDMNGSESGRLQAGAPPDERLAALDLSPPEIVQVTARDGETLYGAVYPPRGLSAGQKAPVIVSVYGGPHAQRVVNGWMMTADLRSQYWAQEGFLVFKLDNRGSPRRGLAFEGAIAGNLGDLEVRDQVDGVRFLAARPDADTERVGVYGWSYGGYMALMCLARAPEVFKAAVAGAPVTHWDGYDTCYTERYMGHPAENPEGYQRSSVMAHAENIRGRLLLIHGLIDENVHFRHTASLLTVLNRAGIPHELLLFPEERHGPRSEKDRVFLERRIAEFFKQNL